ncbi:acyl-CoA dehydrogenase [Actinomadura violacea]|uniref:Acyl-CoA dehydrogenase n=1 Tax=Actinomadura violacea TaxID=2819934 RepID=A0ABS3RNJ9_9ACTN|nr:acyl-CoA dehydrogenase [Actinomadura violacea]MBO2458308.1 acyl-CoA dehydrogenase [Actinomadura violacea]
MSAQTAAGLEAVFGPPGDPANPFGLAAVVRADELGAPPPAARAALAAFGVGAEFVPRELGGRFDRADRMVRVLRPLGRRDLALLIGSGAIGLIAAAPVWVAGDAAQRAWTAELLLGGARLAAAFTELGHGSDAARMDLRAVPRGDGFALTGGKQVINELDRADACVLLARTGTAGSARDLSLFLLDMAGEPGPGTRFLPPFPLAVLRGSRLVGVEFDERPVPAGALLGERGHALEVMGRAFQVTRATLPGMILGSLDTLLRTTVAFALERRLYGRSVADLPHAAGELTGVFADLLACDAMATVAARSLHLLPGETSVSSALTKYLVPELLQDAADRLGAVLGARSYLREGPHAIFQKHLRDLLAASVAHTGGTVCLASVIPQLPALARRAGNAGAAPATVFRPDADLPALPFDRLALSARGSDSVASLWTAPETADLPEPIAALHKQFAAEAERLRARAAALPPRERVLTAGPEGFAVAERYAVLWAAACCLGVWRHSPDHHDEAWAVVALHRLAGRLGLVTGPPPAAHADRLHRILLDRHERRRSFDLADEPLATQG